MATIRISVSKGVPVTTVYSVNIFDIPRIQSLLKALLQSYAGDERITLNVPERQVDSRGSTQQDSLDEVKNSQLSPLEKEALVEILKEYADVFAVNLNAVAACRGPPMRLELKDPYSAPHVAPIRHYTPEQRNMIRVDIEKLHKAGEIVPSTSQYASCCHTVRKKVGTVRKVQDF